MGINTATNTLKVMGQGVTIPTSYVKLVIAAKRAAELGSIHHVCHPLSVLVKR